MAKRPFIYLAAVMTPIVGFYWLAVGQTIDMPFLDDYGGVLGFVSSWIQLGSVHRKLMWILTSQHNEYKPMFANSIYILQYLASGHVNFWILSMVGNLLLIPVFIVTYYIWMSDTRKVVDRLLLFIPVSWVLFQLQYYSLVSWPASTLQNIPVVLFALLAIYLLSRDEPTAFYLSLGSFVLAIGSSGNGFFLLPIGSVMLLQFHRITRLIIWLATSAGMLTLYLYKYDFMASQAHADHSIASSLHHISPLYAISFLGASIARYGAYAPAAILGGLLCAVFAYATFDKLYSSNPATFYSMLFIFITAFAVSGLRSDLGIAQSLVSRYRIYSNILLIFVYLYCIGKVQVQLKSPSNRTVVAVFIGIVTIGFNVGSNLAGFKLLRSRTELTKEGMRRWENGERSIASASASPSEDAVIQRQRLNGNFEPEDHYLREAIALHIYAPPPQGRIN